MAMAHKGTIARANLGGGEGGAHLYGYEGVIANYFGLANQVVFVWSCDTRRSNDHDALFHFKSSRMSEVAA